MSFGPARAPISSGGRYARIENTGVATASISGTITEGQTLTCTFNNNDPDGAATAGPTFQWIRDAGTTIVGATNSTYVLTNSDALHTVKCAVRYTDGKGFQEEIFTASTGTISGIDSGNATATVTGNAWRTQTLTSTFNDDDPDGPATGVTRQWIRDSNTTIIGQTGTTYVLTSDDVGHTVKCRFSYTDAQGFAETIDSNSTATITDLDTGDGTATQSGSGVVGATQTATYNNNDPDGAGTVVGYQWLRNGGVIFGAISQTYVAQSADLDQSLSCQVSYTDGHGNGETVTTNSVTIGPNVVPGSASADSGSGNATIPPYNVLTIRWWGAAAGGSGVSLGTYVHGGDGGATTLSGYGTANGGTKGSGTPGAQAGGVGGTGSLAGGDSQFIAQGNPGGNGNFGANTGTTGAVNSGAGGSPAFTGVGGAAVSSNPVTAGNNGNDGTAPGGAGSGAAWYSGGFSGSNYGAPGGGAGAYQECTFTRNVTPGAPAIGALIPYSVGTGGVGGNGTQRVGGNGKNGRLQFDWS